MYEAKKAKTDGALLLCVGLVSGFFIAAGLFFALSHHKTLSAKPPQVASVPAAAETPSKAEIAAPAPPQPVPTPPPARVEAPIYAQSPAPIYYTAAPSVAAGQMQVVPATVVQQPGLVVQPDGSYVTGMATSVPTEYENSPYGDNPNWSVSRNGLIGNPPVDPPSSKGRAYGLANQSY